jgi:hypothetical protein
MLKLLIYSLFLKKEQGNTRQKKPWPQKMAVLLKDLAFKTQLNRRFLLT